MIVDLVDGIYEHSGTCMASVGHYLAYSLLLRVVLTEVENLILD
jgi:hypothetical protein